MAKIRVRARAVDMLGRQQIAGIPTAIHELFKNAHDAYAARVEVDFFRADRVLVLRDDGTGMTRAEFESRWLTLGTEAKVGANTYEVPWLASKRGGRRPILGEKGIGRFASSRLADELEVVSRKQGVANEVYGIFDWRQFDDERKYLDEILILWEERAPLEIKPGGSIDLLWGSNNDMPAPRDQALRHAFADEARASGDQSDRHDSS